eukprot:1525723-Prymnesium_polylepis.1
MRPAWLTATAPASRRLRLPHTRSWRTIAINAATHAAAAPLSAMHAHASSVANDGRAELTQEVGVLLPQLRPTIYGGRHAECHVRSCIERGSQ